MTLRAASRQEEVDTPGTLAPRSVERPVHN